MLVDGAFGWSFEEFKNFEPLLLKSGFERHCYGMSESESRILGLDAVSKW